MSAVLVLRGQEYPVQPGQTLSGALQSLKLDPESYLAVRDGEIVPPDTPLREGDVVKLVAVISGGEDRHQLAG